MTEIAGGMALSAPLTENFTFGEFVTTRRRSLAQANYESAHDYLASIQATAQMLQAVRDRWGRIKVNSGYRCPALNAAIGGSKTSQHMAGEAVDFVPLDADMETVFWWVVEESGLDFHQVILEGGTPGRPVWIHLGLPRGERDGQVMSWNTAEGYKFLR